jgi:hypothetical protein
VAGDDLKEEEHRRGERPKGRLNSRPGGTHRTAEQGLEAEASGRGSRVTGERKDDNGMGAGTGDESETAADREKPLDGRNPARGSGMQ